MRKRLQVLLDEDEFRETERIARQNRMTISEWVRQALRHARQRNGKAIDAKLAAIDAATRHRFPTADIEQMLTEIDSGRDAD